MSSHIDSSVSVTVSQERPPLPHPQSQRVSTLSQPPETRPGFSPGSKTSEDLRSDGEIWDVAGHASRLLKFMWTHPMLDTWWPEFLWLCLIRIVSLGALVGLEAASTYPVNWFMTALSEKHATNFYRYMGYYVIISVIVIPLTAIDRYQDRLVYLKLRDGMSKSLLRLYHSNNNFYRMLDDKSVDNPGQRLCDDVEWFSWGVTVIVMLFLKQVFVISYSMIVLIHIQSGILPLVFIVSLAITVLGVFTFGRRMVNIAHDISRDEAFFRGGMARTREHAETICFYNASDFEEYWSYGRMAAVLDDYQRFAFWEALLSSCNRSIHYMTHCLPYLVMAKSYFDKQITFGTMSQAAVVFADLTHALSVITFRMDSLSKISAGSRRVCEIITVIEKLDAKDDDMTAVGNQVLVSPRVAEAGITPSSLQLQKIERTKVLHPRDHIVECEHVTFIVPRSHILLCSDLNLDISYNVNLLIAGPSGCGKSSLFRILSGIWDIGIGCVRFHDEMKFMFLPQRPYLPMLPLHYNTLKNQICFPMSSDFNYSETDITDDMISTALDRVNLNYLTHFDDIDVAKDKGDWTMKLSLGEQQRLAFARVLIHRPDIVFLDEATSALDEDNQKRLYNLLKEEDITFVSVGHRTNLARFHESVLYFNGDGTYDKMTPSQYMEKMNAGN